MKNEFYYNSQDGFTEIHAVEWIPATPVTGIIQICHGMAEYIERYSEFAEYMCAQGFYVVGNDHLGHGKSVRGESYLGHFQETNGNEYVIGDIRTLQETRLKKYPGVPYIMMGHSMGSFLLRQYLTIYGEDVSAAIIMGTGVQPAYMVKMAQILCKIIATAKGTWKYKSKLMDKIVVGGFNKKFQPEKTGVEWLSVNEENCVRYVADPLCGFSFTLGGYNQMFAGMAHIAKEDNVKAMPKEIPVLFISGAEDPVGGFSKDVKKVYKQFKDLGMKDVTIRLYPGDRHEVLKEDNREAVMDDILSWIYGSRENLADEEFPVSEALEFRAISLDEKSLRKPVSAASIVAEFEGTEKKNSKKKKAKKETPKEAPKAEPKKSDGPKFEIPKVDFKPTYEKPVAAQSDIKWPEVKSSGRDVRDLQLKLEETKLVTENVGVSLEDAIAEKAEKAAEQEPKYKLKPITVFDMGVTKGLTPLSSTDEEGMTESDILAEHLKSILTGEYERKLFEEEQRAAEEAARIAAEEAAARIAAEEAARAARAAEELAKIAEKAKLEEEADDEEIEELLAETEDETVDSEEDEAVETEEAEDAEEEAEEEQEEEPEEIVYASEEDALLAFIDKLDAEKIARGEPIAVYEPEVPEIAEPSGKKKPGPVLSELVMSKPITADLEEAFATEEMPVDMIDITNVGDVLSELSDGSFNAETEELDDELDSLPEDEYAEEDEFGETEELEPIEDEAEAEEVEAEPEASEEEPAEEPVEEAAPVFADEEGYMMDLSAELDTMEDVNEEDFEEEDFDEEDFEEAELEEEDFDEEDFEEEDSEEDFDEEDEVPFDEIDEEPVVAEETAETEEVEAEEAEAEKAETKEAVAEEAEIEETTEAEEAAAVEDFLDFDLEDASEKKESEEDFNFDVDIFDEEDIDDLDDEVDGILSLLEDDFDLDPSDEEPTIDFKK